MTWYITYHRAAAKKLSKLPKKLQQRIGRAINQLSSNPFKGKRMEGEFLGYYRLRIGDWRVIYEIQPESEQESTVLIRSVSSRGDAYK